MKRKPEAQNYSPEEAKRRFEATLRGALKTPPMPLKSAASTAKTDPKSGARKAAKSSP